MEPWTTIEPCEADDRLEISAIRGPILKKSHSREK
jgi:hypothetical protein